MQLFDLEFWLHIGQNSNSGKGKLEILNFTDIYFFQHSLLHVSSTGIKFITSDWVNSYIPVVH